MTDTTDQQAVTVAQPSDAATRIALTATPETFPRDSYGLAQWIDQGLASVSSASAELPAGMKAWAGGDGAPDDWDGGITLWDSGTCDKLNTPDVGDNYSWTQTTPGPNIIAYTPKSEPVPATNQAGEVEAGLVAMLTRDHARMRKAGTALAEAALYSVREYDGLHRLALAAAEWAKAVADEGDRAALATQPATSQEGEACAHGIRAPWQCHDCDAENPPPPGYDPLATQPATSQEGEGTGWVAWNPDTGEEYTPNHPVESGECVEAEHIRRSTPQEDTLWQGMQDQFMRAEALAASLAATRTPPTLSEDLLDTCPEIADPASGPEPSLREMVRSFYNRHAVINPDAVTDQYFAALALAQVKAS